MNLGSARPVLISAERQKILLDMWLECVSEARPLARATLAGTFDQEIGGDHFNDARHERRPSYARASDTNNSLTSKITPVAHE